jgi:hypothetical protein
MNKFPTSPTADGFDDVDGNRSSAPPRGDSPPRAKRPRAPQFGTDRRGPRDSEARRPQDASPPSGTQERTPANADHGTGLQRPERRKATRDRRHSYS